eukprot:gene25291-biopygen2986
MPLTLRAGACTRPTAWGGLGLRPLYAIRDAAFVEAWLQCAAHVCSAYGRHMPDFAAGWAQGSERGYGFHTAFHTALAAVDGALGADGEDSVAGCACSSVHALAGVYVYNLSGAWHVLLPGFCAPRGRTKRAQRAKYKPSTAAAGPRRSGAARPAPARRPPPPRSYSRGRSAPTLPSPAGASPAVQLQPIREKVIHLHLRTSQRPHTHSLRALPQRVEKHVRICTTTPLAIAVATVPEPMEAIPHTARPEAPDADAPAAADQRIRPRPGGPTPSPPTGEPRSARTSTSPSPPQPPEQCLHATRQAE